MSSGLFSSPDPKVSILDSSNSNTTATDIHTDTTTDTIKENSGSLANTFDAEAVQNELDVQVRVTQTFDTNRQEVKAEINSIIDEANRALEADPNNKEAQQTVEDMQRLGVLVDSISGALYSPADNALGTVANTLSPAIVYEIGQHFKEEGTEGSAAHILAQTLVAAATASLAGNDELTAGFSAGGAEVIAPILADWMYDKETKDLTSEEKSTISAIISLGSAAVGATTGDTTDVISSSVAGTTAVEDNFLTYGEKWQQAIAKNKCNQGDKEACKEFLEWNRLDKERSFGSYFAGAVGQAFVGAGNATVDMWDNSPWYVQGTLLTAGGIVALPVIIPTAEYGYWYTIRNPFIVTGSATIAADILTPGMPSTRTGTGYYIFENYDTGKENLDLIIKKLLD